MIRLKLYYHAKPFLPWGLRMSVRRFFANRKRARCIETWPIDAKAGIAPPGWTGWPEGKRFAFLLSHDVELKIGYDKLDKLLDIEESLGFRSVINFIPEGQYRVSDERIRDLKSRGFEVGVHGLRHDGKLYNNLATFEHRAKQINRYMKEWGSCGFRSPLMHRNLEWLHKLDGLYDSSTFDTDPFEPQPEGLGTVFPQWIPNPNASESQREGYVELPYTLPQDSTLFLLLREKNIDIWTDKTEWIAQRGGMVFLNTHPDYVDFDGSGSNSLYSADHYRNFLQRVKEDYADQYWHTTPCEVASRFDEQRKSSLTDA